MPIKNHGGDPKTPQNKQQRQAVKADEVRMKSVEGQDARGLKAAVEDGRK